MKRHLLFKSLLLLCALVVGSSSVWAQAPVNTVLWSEDFSGYSADDVPSGDITNSHTGTTVYGDVTLTYACENGGTDTKIYNDKSGPNTSSNDLNLLVAKNNGTFSVSGISTGGAEELTISYGKAGSGTLAISSSTTGVTISGSTITTNGATTLQLTFKNTHASKNLRIDDISVKVKTAGTGGGGVAAPTFSVAEGAVAAGTTVELAQANDYTIRYTTDGSTPSKTTGTIYNGTAITITTPTTIKAIAVNGDDVSAVSAASYTISVAKPTFDVAAGEVVMGTPLTITAAAGHTIIYTTDGTDPSYSGSNGDIYDSPIAINNEMTVKAIAVDPYDNESDITSASYTVSYPGAINITPNYTFFGKSAAFSGTDFNEVTGTTAEGIKVTYTRNGGSLYASTTAMRVYKENTIKIDAPSDKMITRIIFTQSNATDDNLTAAPTEYTNATHTWTGNSSSVTFTRPAKSDSYLQFTKITVVLAAKVTIGTYQWVTYVSDQVMDFTGSDVKAYVVTGASGSAITKTPVTKAAANTPLLLNAPAETYTIPAAATGTNYSTTNKLVAGTGAAVAYDANSGYNYVLSIDNGKAMFMRIVDGTPATVPSGKAYLALDAAPSGARGLNLFDDEDVTGIDATLVNSEKVNSDVFDLSGRKVANPTKGLYIVNGKKYVIK